MLHISSTPSAQTLASVPIVCSFLTGEEFEIAMRADLATVPGLYYVRSEFAPAQT
jgi:hypothetical protein